MGMVKWFAVFALALATLLASGPRLSKIQPLERDVDAYLAGLDLKGKRCIVTGGTNGVGFEAAKELSRAGASVLLTGRSQKRADAAVRQLDASTPGQVHQGFQLDLTSPTSVRRFSASLKGSAIDVLLLNAGMMYSPGYKGPFVANDWASPQDVMVAANHLGSFLLVQLLLHEIKVSGSRVVFVSSISHSFGTGKGVLPGDEYWAKGIATPGTEAGPVQGFMLYGQTKLMNVLTAKKLERYLGPDCKATVVTCTPGFVATAITNTERNSKFKLTELVPLARSAKSGGNVLVYASTAKIEPMQSKLIMPYWIWEGADKLFAPFFSDPTVAQGLFHNLVQEALLQRLTPAGVIYAHSTNLPSHDLNLQDRLWNWSLKVTEP